MIWSSQNGASRQALTFDQIRAFTIPVPPLAEQSAIVNHLESQLAIIGEARGRIEREIELARELYQTLVTNVVTGAADVSNVVVKDDGAEVELPDAEVEMDETEDDEALDEDGES